MKSDIILGTIASIDFKDEDSIKNEIDFIRGFHKIGTILTRGYGDGDSIIIDYAKSNNIAYEIFEPDFSLYNELEALEIENENIIRECNMALAFIKRVSSHNESIEHFLKLASHRKRILWYFYR